jgi:hypothetical protein
MPVVASRFRPPIFLRNGHVQTILPTLLRRVAIPWEAERLELPDGDFLDLGWLRGSGSERVAIVSHGLEGSHENHYVSGMARTLRSAGWDALAWNFRGCGREANRLARFYHSGETGDLAAVVQHAAALYRRIALIGFSLGGNMTLKLLGEAPPHPAIVGAVAISAPVDLAASARALDQRWSNRVYLRRFLKTLITKVEAKAACHPQQINAAGARRIRSFQEFDDRYTAPLHGFRDAADYWARSSAKQYLPRVPVPTLLLNARNDPFLTAESFPWKEAEASTHVFLEAPESGGHVGFLDLERGLQPWSERRAAHFLAA